MKKNTRRHRDLDHRPAPDRMAPALARTCCLAVLGCLSVAAGAFGEEQKGRVGRAYAADSGVLIYSEHHQEWWKSGRVLRDTVTYRDADGAVIAEKRVDFRLRQEAPQFQLRNVVTGHAESAEIDDDGLEVRFRKSEKASVKKESLPFPDGAIVDAGFDRFVENHWQRLMDGEVFVRPFLVPSRMRFIDFRIRRIDKGSDPERATFELAIDSPLLRLLAPDLKVDYDTAQRTLLRYEGLSNMRDARGENHDVEILFDPPPRLAAAAANAEERAGAGVR